MWPSIPIATHLNCFPFPIYGWKNYTNAPKRCEYSLAFVSYVTYPIIVRLYLYLQCGHMYIRNIYLANRWDWFRFSELVEITFTNRWVEITLVRFGYFKYTQTSNNKENDILGWPLPPWFLCTAHVSILVLPTAYRLRRYTKCFVFNMNLRFI